MKKRALAITAGLIIAVGSLFAQTLTDVINEFNAGVESLNGQSYETALAQFNNCLALCEEVGDEAADMKKQAQEQVVGTHYRQAMTLMKRKQYDKAIPSLENTVTTSAEYEAKQEYAEKASKYLPKLYLREGKVKLKQEKLDEAMEVLDKALALDDSEYEAHQYKGLVYKEKQEIESMMAEFNIAKEMAIAKGDQAVIDEINGTINLYYRALIDEEAFNIDEEEPDYTFLMDICQEGIEANDQNSYAYYKLAWIYNKEVEYDTAIEYAEKAVAFEQDQKLLSALYYELGIAYQNTVRYKDACEAYNKVTEEPFFSMAEKKMMTTPDCN